MKEKISDGGILEVGDVVIVSTCIGDNKFKITRVTKTLAISKLESGYEHKFKRAVGFNMSHPNSESTNSYSAYKGAS